MMLKSLKTQKFFTQIPSCFKTKGGEEERKESEKYIDFSFHFFNERIRLLKDSCRIQIFHKIYQARLSKIS
jgi:hypothetical protein